MNQWLRLGTGVGAGLMLGGIWANVIGAHAVVAVGAGFWLGCVIWLLISSFLSGGSSRRRGPEVKKLDIQALALSIGLSVTLVVFLAGLIILGFLHPVVGIVVALTLVGVGLLVYLVSLVYRLFTENTR